jgi:hypothetical protein
MTITGVNLAVAAGIVAAIVPTSRRCVEVGC